MADINTEALQRFSAWFLNWGARSPREALVISRRGAKPGGKVGISVAGEFGISLTSVRPNIKKFAENCKLSPLLTELLTFYGETIHTKNVNNSLMMMTITMLLSS